MKKQTICIVLFNVFLILTINSDLLLAADDTTNDSWETDINGNTTTTGYVGIGVSPNNEFEIQNTEQNSNIMILRNANGETTHRFFNDSAGDGLLYIEDSASDIGVKLHSDDDSYFMNKVGFGKSSATFFIDVEAGANINMASFSNDSATVMMGGLKDGSNFIGYIQGRNAINDAYQTIGIKTQSGNTFGFLQDTNGNVTLGYDLFVKDDIVLQSNNSSLGFTGDYTLFNAYDMRDGRYFSSSIVGWADAFQGAEYSDVETSSSGSWTSSTIDSDQLQYLLDGNFSTTYSVNTERSKFRFTVDAGSWLGGGALAIYQEWVPDGQKGYDITIEYSSDKISWTQDVSVSIPDGQTHVIIPKLDHTESKYWRITFDFGSIGVSQALRWVRYLTTRVDRGIYNGLPMNTYYNNSVKFLNNIVLDDFLSGDGDDEGLSIDNDGNGTFSNDVCVGGIITAEEIKLQQDALPDYVFEEDYALMSIKETEAFINEHKHLPEIPSAQEAKENGVNMGEMQAKLLQKIEELTLYMIEIKKENLAMKNEINVLKAQIKN